jgi:hypothetical protein
MSSAAGDNRHADQLNQRVLDGFAAVVYDFSRDCSTGEPLKREVRRILIRTGENRDIKTDAGSALTKRLADSPILSGEDEFAFGDVKRKLAIGSR